MPRVLAIDDEPSVRVSLRLILEDLDLTVDEARHGQEALELARRHRPDLILCDLDMPVMDGFETLNQVRRDPLLQSVPFVVVSGKLSETKTRRALQDGANSVLEKPFSYDAIQELVRLHVPGAKA